jgi:hypothetical protein
MHTFGYLMFAIAAFVGATNFYLSFVRVPIHWWLGWQCRHISGIPLVGTLFLIAALALLECSALVCIGAVVLCAIDTGGLVWFCLVMCWMAMRKKGGTKTGVAVRGRSRDPAREFAREMVGLAALDLPYTLKSEIAN